MNKQRTERLTDEELEDLICELEAAGFYRRQLIGLVELQERRKADNAEPVLYAAEETLAYAKMGELYLKCLSQPMGDAVIPLYAAPPAPVVPVVPEEITADGIIEMHECGFVEGWNACRAAMLQAGNSPVTPGCSCRTCRPVTMNDMRFVVCPECGNKRCPHANNHRNACTGSNEPGQEGSAYPATPKQEVKP